MAITLLHNQIQESLAEQAEWEEEENKIAKQDETASDKELVERLVEKIGQGITRQGGNY